MGNHDSNAMIHIYFITWCFCSLWGKPVYRSCDPPQTQQSWVTRDAHLSEAAEHLFGLAHGDKIKKAGTLPPFWIWSKTQETFASQQWILNLISHDSAGMEAMCKVSEQWELIKGTGKRNRRQTRSPRATYRWVKPCKSWEDACFGTWTCPHSTFISQEACLPSLGFPEISMFRYNNTL